MPNALELTNEELDGLRKLIRLLNNTGALQLTEGETEGLRKLARLLNNPGASTEHNATPLTVSTTPLTLTVSTGPLTTTDGEYLLGTLIRLLNPYTRVMRYPPGDPAADAHVVERVGDDVLAKLAQFQLEVDDRYGSQAGGNYLFWDFKGQPQTIKKAVRIQFHHPVMESGRPLYWITDHLLVGFAGSNGPG